MSSPAKRILAATPDWLTGIVIEVRDEIASHRMRCRECGELLCVVDPGPLWVLADVARDHRCFHAYPVLTQRSRK